MSNAAERDWVRSHEWVQIPANRVRIGTPAERISTAVEQWSSRLIDRSYSKEQLEQWLRKEMPEHWRDIGAYMITRFPITNQQFRTYIELSKQQHAIPESVQSEQPNDHPVWGVDFVSSARYCLALSQALEREGKHVRIGLPTEFQWEYAARGVGEQEYPYGPTFAATKANSKETGLGWTTSVQHYADHPSSMGVCDMAGNVEEWTRSVYRPYPGGYFIEDDLSRLLGDYHVLRGGSFCLGGDLTRCSRRHGPHPDRIFRFIGFRIVMEPTLPASTGD